MYYSLLFTLIFTCSGPLEIENDRSVASSDHSAWEQLLQKHVDASGNVDYKGFYTDKAALEHYLMALGQSPIMNDADRNEKLAYYINLYNAATVKLILDNYPLKSIKDISRPWGKEWINIGKETLSLGDIEHKILRRMNEPRIHFAINCASYSCPRLSNHAFTAVDMELQLDQAAKDFINDPKRNIITAEKAQLSEIFSWFKKDFTTSGTLAEFLNRYSKTNIDNNTEIEYLNYNWSLNEI